MAAKSDPRIVVNIDTSKKTRRHVIRAYKVTRFFVRGTWRTASAGRGAAWRYRAALAPWMMLALVVTAVLAAQHTSHPTIVGLALAGLVALLGLVITERAKGQQAAYVSKVGMNAAGTWMAVAAVAGTDWRPVRAAGIAVFMVVAVRWWSLHTFSGGVTQAAVNLAGLAMTWRLRMAKVLPDVHVVNGTSVPIIVAGRVIGEEALIEAGDDSDLTTTEMIAKTEKATARFRLPMGQFVIDVPDDGLMHQAKIMMFFQNPLRQTQDWPGVDFELATGMSSVGPRMDGTLADYVWSVPRFGAWHDMIAGTTGAGKSSFISMLFATSRAAGGAIVDWVIDPQAGQSAPAWKRNVDRFATSAEQGLILLQHAERVMYARNRLLAAYKWTDHKGRCQEGFEYFPWMEIGMPLLVITIFEAHAVLGLPGAREVVEAIGKMARKCGIKLRLEVQVPLLDQLGNSSTIRAMVASGNVVIFRTAERLSGQVAFNGQLPVDPASIPKAFPGREPIQERVTAGLGYILGSEASAMQFRSWRDPDPLESASTGQTWRLDAASREHEGVWPPTEAEVVATATQIAAAAAQEAESEAQAGTTREQILALLEQEGPLLFNDLQTKTGKSRSSVYGALKKLTTAGDVVETDDASYALKEKQPA